VPDAANWLLDTGPVVALLSRDDRAHATCIDAFEAVRGKLLTTEAVLTEAMHLLSRRPKGANACLEFFSAFRCDPSPDDDAEAHSLSRSHDSLRGCAHGLRRCITGGDGGGVYDWTRADAGSTRLRNVPIASKQAFLDRAVT
jgi:hypothetical protein